MEKKELRQINTTALAYLGDAVYEQAVREHILRKGTYNANNLHTSAVKYVKAQAQANVIKLIYDQLTEEEQSLVKRARNRKYTSRSRNTDPVTYKWATAFEALVGYLYLEESRVSEERLNWVIEQAIEITGK
ncbi:MAG: ribonuclease III domain-containing protein [Lentihominibacter sp.]|nr:Mini-ribonuclease 3 [Clostridiales bacterium]MDY2680437.1 ribonuclease III domain-containing protein [Lentihominibacter sp.]